MIWSFSRYSGKKILKICVRKSKNFLTIFLQILQLIQSVVWELKTYLIAWRNFYFIILPLPIFSSNVITSFFEICIGKYICLNWMDIAEMCWPNWCYYSKNHLLWANECNHCWILSILSLFVVAEWNIHLWVQWNFD